MMQGRSLVPPVPTQDPYIPELEAAEDALDPVVAAAMKSGGWRLSFRPVEHVGELVRTNEALRLLIEKHTVNGLLRGPFPPPVRFGQPQHEWGVTAVYSGTAFGMTRSGLFLCYRPYWENTAPLPHGEEKSKVRWLGYRQNIYVLTEFCLFLSRFATEYKPGTIIRYDVAASDVRGRIMSDSRAGLLFHDTDPAVAIEFKRSATASVEDLRAGWIPVCTDTATRFVQLFTGAAVTESAVESNIHAFINNRIWG
jgi:hypothetical protein